MNCLESRDRMLEADLEELSGNGPSFLADHIRGCPSCHQAAMVLLSETNLARSAYRSLAPARPLKNRRVVHRGRAMLAVASMVAVAAMAIVYVRRPSLPPHVATTSTATPAPDLPSVTVEVPDGSNAIVFGTSNPLVDVVWIYQGN